ncbi:hypothetical protein H0H93_002535 [Arthromyces matolae]|nr:hypothetical protein H0H93_002535 [Arthromyces matolae]
MTAIGEVWANILHNVLFALVNALGLSDITDIDSPKGNVVFMHLFVDSLSLQPCNPTFVSARDAWIAADLARYGARHSCILYKAFASRGNAAKYVNNFEVPQSCQEI